MIINRLSGNRVLIVLCEQDIADSPLDFENIDFGDSRQRQSVIGITKRACRSSGIDTGGRRVNIEALPLEKSCYLLVTVGGAKRYRLKNAGSLCYKLGGIDSFLDAVEQLYRKKICCRKNSAYKKDGAYFLVFDYPALPAGIKRVLSEYGERQRGRFAAERIRESAAPVCTRNAIESIGKFLV